MSRAAVNLERQNKIAVITLDRPDRKNTMNLTMWEGLTTVLDHLEKKHPRAVVITGAGDDAFCAGMDVNPDNPQIKSVVDAVFAHDRKPVEHLIGFLRKVCDRLVSLPVPVIAAVNGKAWGGGAELAMRCDLRVMDHGAMICFSEVRLGLMPDWGGGVALTRLAGPAVAADLILTGRKVSADEAIKLGIVNRVSKPGSALKEALLLAETIAENGPLAVQSALEVIRKTPDLPQEQALALEYEKAVSLIASGECVQGITAFLSKKKPAFPDPE